MDSYFFHFLNQWAGQWIRLDTLTIFVAIFLPYWLVVFLIGWLIWKKTIKMIVVSLVAALFSRFIITEIIRWFYYQPRPFVTEQVNQLVEHSTSGSFPSGHAAFLFALSMVIYLHNKKAGWVFFTASFLICLARIFTGLHYPSDILAGTLIGLFFGWLIYFLWCRRRESNPQGPKSTAF